MSQKYPGLEFLVKGLLPGAVLPLWPKRGASVVLRLLPNGYHMALFLKHKLPIGDILIFLPTYEISTRYAPQHGNMLIEAIIINEF